MGFLGEDPTQKVGLNFNSGVLYETLKIEGRQSNGKPGFAAIWLQNLRGLFCLKGGLRLFLYDVGDHLVQDVIVVFWSGDKVQCSGIDD